MRDRLSTYLDQLPDGWASFPECTAKSVLFSRQLELVRTEWLPPELLHRVEQPQLPTAWAPEVEQVALTLAIYDHRVHSAADEAAFHEDMLALNLKLFQLPAYAPLVANAAPERLMRMMSESWHLFHRGSSMSLIEGAPGMARMEFRFPARLFPDELIRTRTTSVRGALVAASAKNVEVDYHYETPGHVRYEARWETD